MNCPRCRASLHPEVYEGVEVDRCAACKGIWLDDGELQPILNEFSQKFSNRLIQSALGNANLGIPASEKASVEPCPKCSKPMDPMNWGATSGVVVDRCVEHGVWFDHEELDRVQAVHEAWSQKIKDPELRAKLAKRLDRIEAQFEADVRDFEMKFRSKWWIGRLLIALGLFRE